MTVTTEVARVTFPWTGVETSFSCGFPADQVSHLRVLFRTDAGVSSLLALGVNYNATLASGTKLATITPISFPASSGTLIVTRATPAQVAEVLADGQEYSLAVIQQLHDRAAMRSAEDRSKLARAILLAEDAELGDGNFDLGGSGISNAAPGTSPNDLATVAQILDLVIASGNVPAPLPGDLLRFLVATGPGTFAWLAMVLAQIPDGLFTADAAGLAKFANGFLSADAAGRAKLADGFLSADAAGRAKMDDDFVTSAELAASALGPRAGMINGTLKTTRAGNAETFAVKTLAGADPSSGDPVIFVFQDGTGGYVRRRVTAALSVAASSGSTLGADNATPFRVWCVAADDAGTVRLGIVKAAIVTAAAASVMALSEYLPHSSSAEGGAGAADTAQVIYSGTAFSAKYLCLVGYCDFTLAAAGTWVTAPTATITFGPGVKRPGEVVQTRRFDSVTYASTATTMPADDTLPQVTEGAQIGNLPITFSSAANLFTAEADAQIGVSTTGTIVFALFGSGSADALAAKVGIIGGTNWISDFSLRKSGLCATSSALTFSTRFGPSSAVTAYVNGASGGRQLGGATAASLSIEEIMA